MEGMEYFYELFETLPRCGPGNNESTRRAFNTIPKHPEQPLILDIGCGPGVQTIELARLSKGRIIALDNHQAFLDKLIETAKEEALLDHIVPSNRSMLDMNFEENTFDIIWSEGALYFMGFRNGLRRCHQLLKNDGFLAVTEIVYRVNNPPAPLIQYFEKEYPDIRAVKDNIDLIQNERFRLISHFTLPESSWLDSFYLPMEEAISRLNQKYQGNKIALDIFEEMKNEIDLYKKFSDYYGYEFFVMQKKPVRRSRTICSPKKFFGKSSAVIKSALDRYPRKQLAHDDVLDALVNAVTAARLDASIETLPAEPIRDRLGLPMQMVSSPSGLWAKGRRQSAPSSRAGGYEDGSWKGPGPSLLVTADFY